MDRLTVRQGQGTKKNNGGTRMNKMLIKLGEIKQFWIRRAGRADQTMRDSNIKPDLILPADCGITRHRLIRLCRGKRCEFFLK